MTPPIKRKFRKILEVHRRTNHPTIVRPSSFHLRKKKSEKILVVLLFTVVLNHLDAEESSRIGMGFGYKDGVISISYHKYFQIEGPFHIAVGGAVGVLPSVGSDFIVEWVDEFIRIGLNTNFPFRFFQWSFENTSPKFSISPELSFNLGNCNYKIGYSLGFEFLKDKWEFIYLPELSVYIEVGRFFK